MISSDVEHNLSQFSKAIIIDSETTGWIPYSRIKPSRDDNEIRFKVICLRMQFILKGINQLFIAGSSRQGSVECRPKV